MQDDHSAAVVVLGLALVIAAAATSPYWHNVGLAVRTGAIQTTAGPIPYTPANATLPAARAAVAPGSGLWLTLGTLVLVIVLAGFAKISPSASALALVLLLGLWVLFLLGHVSGFQRFFALFTPAGQSKAASA